LPVGLNLRMLVPTDSYLLRELQTSTNFFSAYGGYGYCVTMGAQLQYNDRNVSMNYLILGVQ
jgi:hypothetical protein